jgi:4-amino-4-deoxy-L-arabinose transferase-like glycosyltransferase
VNVATRPAARYSAPTEHRRNSERAIVPVLAFTVVLVAGVALRLWHLDATQGWQWDEAVYLRVGLNVQHGLLEQHSVYGSPWQPFLYQPPLYFVMLARWFSLVGASMYHARVLGVIATAVMLLLLFRLLSHLHGVRAALFAVTPVVFDGWLLYIERASYIENVLMVIIVASMLLYQRALERPTWYNFAIAGVMIGCGAAFKQTGTYVIFATLLTWLIVRRSHRGHLVMLSVAIGVIAIYLVAMIRMYDLPGHPWFIEQSLVQVRRVLGLKHSGGTLTSPTKLLHLLAAQYKYFVPSFLIAVASLVLAVRRVLQCYRARNWLPASGNALLFSWFVAGVVVFGVSSLRFPQYFALILVPAYCFMWTELWNWDWLGIWRNVAPVAATVAGIASLLLALRAFQTNTLEQVQNYASTKIPAGAIVVTEETIGDLIPQRWCAVEAANSCLHGASYAITWKTYLQSSFTQGNPAFHELMQGAHAITSFSGPIGTATVWTLKGTP